MNLSLNYDRYGKERIGSYFEGNLASPFLHTGVIDAIYRLSGKTPSVKRLLVRFLLLERRYYQKF